MELVTGGQRLHRHEDYLAAVDERAREALAGYLKAFRHGMPPHGGFAIGLERWTASPVDATSLWDLNCYPVVISGRRCTVPRLQVTEKG